MLSGNNCVEYYTMKVNINHDIFRDESFHRYSKYGTFSVTLQLYDDIQS